MNDLLLPLGAAALFGALLLFLIPLTRPQVRRRRLARELSGEAAPSARSQLAGLGARATGLADRALTRHDQDGSLGVALERAGIDVRPAEFAVLVVSSAFGAALIGAFLGGLLVGLGFAALVIVGFAGAVHFKAKQRRKKFDEQLPDSLALLAGGLRAGHSLPQALDALVQESPSPTSEEFRRVLFETQLGHTLSDALRNLAVRIRSDDFEWVAQAIEIQNDVGGDLAALLDNVTATIRDRTRVKRQIDTLTAEGRLSAIILFCLPLGMVGFISFSNPAYFGELTSTLAGNVMMIVGGVLLVVGGLWLRRIVRMVY